MNFSDLEVINDDILEPHTSVPEHGHENMDIYGYVVNGPCTHWDNLGNSADIPSGSVQRMVSGKGIRHTEANNTDSAIRYIQIWVKPNSTNLEPSWDWISIPHEERLDNFFNVTEGLPINQNARLLSGIFTESHTHSIVKDRKYYVYIVGGKGSLNQSEFDEGDGFYVEQETQLEIAVTDTAEIIMLDLQ
jgi:redox-sensitive bicupin YhaK (pirin superfamily)